MRAIILAGGKGTRLLPFTTLIPKPLVPLGGRYSILEIVLIQLSRAGFDHVTLAVNRLSNLIMSYFGDGSRWDLTLDYSLEDQPLSTIGPLTLIKDLPDNFLVMNGDILCDLDYGEFFRQHITSNNLLSVSAYHREVMIDFGVLEYDHNYNLTGFREKPTFDFNVSMGIYCLNKKAINHVQPNTPYGFDDLMREGLAKQQKIQIIPFSGFWLDIGRPEDYQYADQNFDSLSKSLGIMDASP